MAKPKHPAPPKKSGSNGSKWAGIIVMLLLVGGGLWGYQFYQTRKAIKDAEVDALVHEARELENAKHWDKALKAFEKVEKLDPKSVHFEEAKSRIESLRAQVVTAEMQIAQSAFALKDWPATEAALGRILKVDEENAAAKAMFGEIQAARQQEEVSQFLKQAETAAAAQKWDDAFASLEKLSTKYPARAEAKSLYDKIQVAKTEAEKHIGRARELLAQAQKRDIGVFDAAVFALVNEAKSLAPNDAEVTAFLGKISAYPRDLKVPSEVATLNEALALARANDRIVVSAGVYRDALIINKPVEIVGDGQVIVETAGESNPALTLGPGAQNARISGLTFRHTSMDTAAERFPAVLIRGSAVAMRDCVFSHASGHGVMVMDQGRVGFAQCRFEANGWDGLSVQGEGSVVNVKASLAARNGEHGVDIWKGASGVISESVCSNNQRNGITLASAAANASLANNLCEGNREYGIVLVSAAGGTVSGNQAKANGLGGIVVRSNAANVTVQNNKTTANLGPGLSLEKGLDETKYKANEALTNRGKLQIAGGLEFTE